MSNLTSENKIVQLLRQRHPKRGLSIKKGIGDDAAVIHPNQADEYWMITTDMLLEGVDFRREWTPPLLLGRKSIAVNISDLAAMGARPRFFTVSLAIPPGITEKWILDLYRGLTAPDSSKGAQLIGGDLSHSGSGVLISITAVGESLNRKILYRSGGRAGDLLYVTGVLGRSAAGLKLLQSGNTRTRSRPKQEALQAHRTPVPRCEIGLWLAQSGLVRCMMDLSDGLSMDLPRLCSASGVGAEIELTNLPVFTKSRLWDCDPIQLALDGGEDYELIFAVPKAKSRVLENNYPSKFPKITKIGKLTQDAKRIWILAPDNKRCPLPENGYDHFSEAILHKC
jgi:thiamine-monophosphate kinase